MKARQIWGCIAALTVVPFIAASCDNDNDEPSGAPEITISSSEITFEPASSGQTLEVTANRDWKASTEEDWISVEPSSGEASSKAQTVTITVLENTGTDRTASVKFDIGFDAKTLTVNQAGEGGSEEDRIVYSNNFDKEEATKTYGTSSSSWPYLDQFEGWKNATGTGAGAEEYAYSGMSVRANSTSSGNYSDYEGSGSNNLFFGSSAYFSVTGIVLPSDANYTLSFGSEKYSQDNGSLFTASEFHVYISNDGSKWVELEYAFANGYKEGRWDVATSTFTVPSGTSTLGIYVKTDVASAYRLDDLNLSVSTEAGTAIDFSKGTEIGGGTTDPTDVKDVTIAEFLAAEVSTTQYYRISGTVTGTINTTYGNYTVTDGTNSVYIYGTTNFSDYSATFAVGGTVTLVGVRYDYNGTAEMKDAKIESYTAPAYTFGVSTTSLSAAADATSATFDVTGNVDWTVTSDNDAFTVSPASGTGNGTVTISFAANTETTAKTANITVATTSSDVTTKSYTVVLTQAAVSSGSAEDFTSNVTWTLGDNSYSETATINGAENISVLKLGASKKVGTATVTIPSGTSKLSFYGISWKSKAATLSVEYSGTSVYTQDLAANDGATSNSPYTITVTDSDKYTIDVATLMGGGTPTSDITVTVTTTGTNTRIILFGIKAE